MRANAKKMTTMDVIKRDHLGREVLRYPAEPLAVSVPNGIAVRAYFARDDVKTAYTTFATGDRLHEYFFADRWYNVFALYAGDSDRLKGWYCNLCRPSVITRRTISCDDLALDVWISAEGVVHLLDWDEYTILATVLSPDEKVAVLAAAKALMDDPAAVGEFV